MERETGFEPATCSLEGRDVPALWHRARGPERTVSSYRVALERASGATTWDRCSGPRGRSGNHGRLRDLRRARLNQRIRQAFIAGAERESRRRLRGALLLCGLKGSPLPVRTCPGPLPCPGRPDLGSVSYLVTLSRAVAECLNDPLCPVTAKENVPRGPDDDVRTVSVDGPVAGFGENVIEEPEGCPLRLRVTDPEEPLDGVMLTV